MLDQITPLIITYNEACNIARTLGGLSWARRIVVVDSGSTDGTLDIVAGCGRAEVAHRPFTDFASQCNFGLTLVTTPWVLSLDADYLLGGDLIDELAALKPEPQTMGYRARFIYCIHGQDLCRSLYPPRVVLYRMGVASYTQAGHAHRLAISGLVGELRNPIRHDDRKPLDRWLASQRTYASAEADHLLAAGPANRADRLRRMAWPAPLGVLPYVLFVKGCVLDGWAGWYYALQRLLAEALLAIEIIDRRLGGDGGGAA
jgi:glycosyltransferase involved in cell wall biosynthesis